MGLNIGAVKAKLRLGDEKVQRSYLGDVLVYSTGNTVTYHVDTGATYQEEREEGESCLSPKTFTPAKAGWTFAGWRQDTAASGSVLSSLAMGNTPITLYAVFYQIITLSYDGNGASGGSTAAQSSTRYWNSGNVANPTFILRANGFSRSGYNFTVWALNGGTQYGAGASVTLAASATMYAVWTAIPATPFYLSSKNPIYTTSGDVESWHKPEATTSDWYWWQVQRNGYYARCETSAFSRQGCTKIKIICFLDGGYFYVNSKRVALHGYGSGKEIIVDISDQPDTITCAIQAEGDGKGGHYDYVQIVDPYFY